MTQVDASKSGLGACLLQQNQPVAYASRAMSSSETRSPDLQNGSSQPLVQMEIVGMDLVHFQGQHALVIVDYYSGFLTYDIRVDETSKAATAVLNNVFRKFGLAEKIISDNGPCFKSDDFPVSDTLPSPAELFYSKRFNTRLSMAMTPALLSDQQKSQLSKKRSAHLNKLKPIKQDNYIYLLNQPIWLTDDDSDEWKPGYIESKDTSPDSYWIINDKTKRMIRQNKHDIKPCYATVAQIPITCTSEQEKQPGKEVIAVCDNEIQGSLRHEEMTRLKQQKKSKQLLVKRMKKACSTRWLSFDKSVAVLYQEYEAVLHTLKALDEDGCATAHGLFNKLKEGKFLGVLFILKDVLPVLSHLLKAFQGGSVAFSQVVSIL
ncbi:hypothetical protein ACROYT_G019144 [Oculina patagonica]